MDVSFPAHITVDQQPDLNGLPILTATVTPADESRDLPLPAGPAGPAGSKGQPRTTFRKMGEIADASARPTGLTADDRGKWWHRLDTNGMDVWDGTTWRTSPGAVGAQGSVAPATTIEAVTTHDPALRVPAARFTGTGPDLILAVTAPAGEQGPVGPDGASGAISESPDYDTSIGAVNRSVFAYNSAARRWRATPPPNGYRPWSWWDTDFNADAQAVSDQLTAGTFALPALPFTWRPMVYGQLTIFCQTGKQSDAEARVRIGSESGVMVGNGAGIRADGNYYYVNIMPTFGDEATKTLSPTSTYATIPAYTESALVVTVERVGNNQVDGQIGFQRSRASLTVWAQPVGG
ncbi:hypothetical protein IU414_06645 [Nocardia farcinica]|uniref:hypothetical protein n=1 Tax=Nocardia farcinica TaxID=37329 RepID=UPI00189370E2|nr:hypothetical protein [Nocardia farcinica]MBF6584438.1 hypothetical protein [Nocardia farcinica]